MEVLIAHSADFELPVISRDPPVRAILQKLSDRLSIASIDPLEKSAIASLPGVVGVFEHEIPLDAMNFTDMERLAVDGWNLRHSSSYQAQKESRSGEGLSWDHPDYEREG